MSNLQGYDFSNNFHGKVINNTHLTQTDSKEDIREIVINIDQDDFFFKNGQSIGVIAPGNPSLGKHNIYRLYTIAGVGASDNTIRLCVKRCFYNDFISGERCKGVASNYLCDLVEGDTISLSGPYGAPFTLPHNNTTDMLMIGLGTGIAPFRALVKHIYEDLGSWEGKIRLFYGAKTGIEMACMNDEKNDFSLYYDKATFKAFEAVSPRPHFDEPVALDKVIKDNAQEVWQMITQRDTHVYIAGLEIIRDLTFKSFIEIAGSKDAWEKQLGQLKETGRWHEVIY